MRWRALLSGLLLLLVGTVPFALSSDTVSLGTLSVRTVKVTRITPFNKEGGLLRLTAELSEPESPACPGSVWGQVCS